MFDSFSSFIKFWSSERNTENGTSDLYFNKERNYSKESISVFKKTCGKEGHEKETKRIYASAGDLLHIRIGNLDWCKCGHCKNEAKEIDRLCCREVNAMLIASAKIQKHERSISSFSFYRLIYVEDEFLFLFLV